MDRVREIFTGVLNSGKRFKITQSHKKAPGVTEGLHYIAIFMKEDGSDDLTPIHNLSEVAFLELAVEAHRFARMMAIEEGRYRIAFNGPNEGRRAHTHIHIILPKGADKLPTLVDTSQGG